MPTTSENHVTMTWGQVAGAGVIIVGGLGAIFFYLMNGVSNNVDAIRQDIHEMRSGVKQDATRTADTTFNLQQSISQILTDVAVTRAQVENMDKSISALQDDVSNIDASAAKLLIQYDGLDARLTRIETGVGALSNQKGGNRPELLPLPQPQ